MTGRGPTAALSAAVALTLLLLLSGCVEVRGTAVRGQSSGRSGSVSNDSLGLARPFLPLPAVTPAAVPDGYDPGADAAADIAAAQAASHADGRPVLLDFGSAWCQDCQALTALVRNPGVDLILARNYHTVTIDVGHYDRNMDLAGRYVSLPGSGIPALVLLGADGTPSRPAGAEQFADARSLSSDQVANLLVDWLYPGN
ncbi:thioredoxin family protein [Streptacidiphilus sp. N1-3]|uniref:Thioredoxin family protein n=1 Tax=Streptacidiphilus alkalitolerans TaxID=3342712 RepID=A0ABV6X7R0_9ACTN